MGSEVDSDCSLVSQNVAMVRSMRLLGGGGYSVNAAYRRSSLPSTFNPKLAMAIFCVAIEIPSLWSFSVFRLLATDFEIASSASAIAASKL
jgi:hypothetical protein